MYLLKISDGSRNLSDIKGQITKKLHWKNSNLLFRSSVYGMKF